MAMASGVSTAQRATACGARRRRSSMVPYKIWEMDRYGLQTIATELDDDGILRVTLNRPQRRNAIDAVMHQELRQLYTRLADDADIEVIVITGAGKGFCAGPDFKQMQANNDETAAYDEGFSSLFVDGVAIVRNILAV